MDNTEKLNLPPWFWQLIPVLTARQSPQDFEAWLLTPAAERIFPEAVYQALIWVNYRQTFVQIYRAVNDILSEDKQFWGKMPDIHAVLSLLAGEYHNWAGCQMLPLPEDYCDGIYGLLLTLDEWEIFGRKESDKWLAEQTMAQFWDDLCAYLAQWRQDLPDIPIL